MDERDVKDTILGLAKRIDEALYAMPKESLRDRYFLFKYDPSEDKAWNLYMFHRSLEHYRSSVRRWEEHHHGYQSLVERVRDEYLMPEIETFIKQLEANNAKV